MKKLMVCLFLISVSAFGQFFEDPETEESSTDGTFFEEESASEEEDDRTWTEIIFGTDARDRNSSDRIFFKESEETEEPEMGEDGGGNPADPAPIDDWLLILPIAAAVIGFRFLYNTQNRESFHKR